MNIYIDLDTGFIVSDAVAATLPNVAQRSVTNDEFEALIEAKRIAEMTQADHFKAIERALEQHMDAVAKADGWDSRWTCVARAGYANPWQSKGIKFAQWMDNCWVVVIQGQAEIISGTRQMPTPEQAIAELPIMVW
jgi:hypothetical protein